jgi:hypothetical protein
MIQISGWPFFEQEITEKTELACNRLLVLAIQKASLMENTLSHESPACD